MRMKRVVPMLVFISALLILLMSIHCSVNQKRLALAAKIHQEALTIDTHCDTPMNMEEGFDIGVRHVLGERGSGKIDLHRMADGGLDAAFFAVYVGQRERTPQGHARAKEYALRVIDNVKEACQKYAKLTELALSPDDAYRIEKVGKRAIFMGMENGYPVGKDISLVDHYYDLGIRYITLCHSSNNEICDSCTDDSEWNGLSPFGEDVVQRMNRLGMIIDVSHLSDSSFYDVIRLSKAPVVASHSCCRALRDHPRNMTDDMIRLLAEKDGVIQICLVSSFVKEMKPNPERDVALDSLRQKYGNFYAISDPESREKYIDAYYAIYERFPREKALLKDLVNHIDHVANLVGIDHVGIGSDFDGGGGVEGCDDASEMGNITVELLRRGYNEEEIRKIWGGNFMRAFRKVVAVSQELQAAS